MPKVVTKYKKKYRDDLIEIREYSGRILLYVNNKEKDYVEKDLFGKHTLGNCVGRKMTLSCKLDNGKEIRIILTRKYMIMVSVTVYVDNTQIDYVSDINQKK